MGFDIPDGPQPIMTVSVIAGEPKQETETTEYAISSYGSKSTSSASYQTVKSWTITASRTGILRAVEMSCDNYAVATWRLTVAGVTVFEDVKFPESFSQGFPDLKLAAASQVLLEVKSDGATTINAYCALDAKEVG